MPAKMNTGTSGYRSKNSGRTETGRLRVTKSNYAGMKTALRRFLILEIERYSIRAGSQNKLSIALGYSDTKVQMVLKRGSFSGLERLWKECREKLGD